MRSLLLSVCVIMLVVLSPGAQSQVPRIINYQGLLTDTQGDPIDGTLSIRFEIYGSETGGTALWSENQSVSVSDGLFHVLLGSVTPIPYSVFKSTETYLELKVGSDQPMQPRMRLVSVGYAMHAYGTDQLGGYNPKDFVRSVDGVVPKNGDIDLFEGSNIIIEPDPINKIITISATSGANTLNQAYNQGGQGAGRIIHADAGAFEVGGTDGAVFTGTYGSGKIPLEGDGTRMMYYPAKSAFRIGTLSMAGSNFWDEDSIGIHSTAMGLDTRAVGKYSVAFGNDSRAGGSNSTAMGNHTNANGDYSTALGVSTIASGYRSIAMGALTTASGSHSTAMGTLVGITGSGSFIIGDNSATTALNKTNSDRFYARFANGYYLYTNSTATIGAYLSTSANSWASISDSTLKENFKPVDGESVLKKINRFKLGTWNYIGQDPQIYRHYGPMAQDFFAAFGHDEIGTIGNDTTLSSADFDGINFIAIQALEKRTCSLQKENKQLKDRISRLENLVITLSESHQQLQAQMVMPDKQDKKRDD
jgi:hypothetical protein